MEELPIGSLMARVRNADEMAAAELVSRVEPHIRRLVRGWLTDPGLRRQMDSIDICQSIMADFFVRAALGAYDVDTPERLIKLLATMARNKVIHHAKKQRAAKRDVRRAAPADIAEMPLAGNSPTPSRVVAGRELLQEFRARLTDAERYLADQRAQGRSWSEIAAELGAKPDALRMRLTRAVDRVTKQLDQ